MQTNSLHGMLILGPLADHGIFGDVLPAIQCQKLILPKVFVQHAINRTLHNPQGSINGFYCCQTACGIRAKA